ncbi:MAG TPA: Asp-tRNA(Asn)/Glu-tRNA(Gln) amidotransferase subunit GatC [Gammaproteobacteria bacterium]|nr:Asp-tRNA(Asn)/Glu-tRNA(Gln) amidotransferase subunit GatC [Gammaproteobacteria bacterium]
MSLTPTEVIKIAHLAKLNLSEEDIAYYTPQLSNILDFVAKMNEVDTESIVPLAHPLELPQRLRPDVINESNQRELFQSIAPKVKVGLYLVPKVIEEA